LSANWNIDGKLIIEGLKLAFRTREKNVLLPFYGFRGNCGCDDDKFEYLFDKVFEPRETRDPVCTRIGEDFEIEGVLSHNFGRENKMMESLTNSLNQMNSPMSSTFKDMLLSLGIRNFQHLFHMIFIQLPEFNQNNDFQEQLQKYQQDKDVFDKYLQLNTDKYNIEINGNPIQNTLSIIERCEINRGGEYLTCPVKTIMAFASVNEAIGIHNPIVSMFNGCKTTADLQRILYENKNFLPRINRTNVKSLEQATNYYEEGGEEEESIEYVTFSSNGNNEDVIPLFWIRFYGDNLKKYSLDLRDSNFSARYVVLKLIDCENLMEKFGDDHGATNIDLQCCSFYGQMLHLDL